MKKRKKERKKKKGRKAGRKKGNEQHLLIYVLLFENEQSHESN